MKHSLLFLLSVLFFTACYKPAQDSRGSLYVQAVKKDLREKLSGDDYQNLDFKRMVATRADSNHFLLRLALQGKSMAEDFVLLKTDAAGNYLDGRIIHIKKEEPGMLEPSGSFSFNGRISINSLNRTSKLSSDIVQGFIVAFQDNYQKTSIAAAQLVEPAIVYLPEVMVFAYRHTDGRGSGSLGTLINLQSLFNNIGGGDYGRNYYSPLVDYSGGGGAGSYNLYSSHHAGLPVPDARTETYSEVIYEEPISVDFENNMAFPAIDVESYLKCFDKIPDEGARCSIEILADVPVDNDPEKLFNWQTGSPGHTFLQIQKTNGVQSVVQNIGFYPNQPWKVTLTPAPIEGKFADNGGHEFNAGLQMEVTPAQLQSVLTKIRYLARFVKYDIDEYNCTDFALDVFNEVRPRKLSVPLCDIPGGLTAAGTSTPQGLYSLLKTMKQTNDPEAANINIPGVKGYVANSSGLCR